MFVRFLGCVFVCHVCLCDCLFVCGCLFVCLRSGLFMCMFACLFVSFVCLRAWLVGRLFACLVLFCLFVCVCVCLFVRSFGCVVVRLCRCVRVCSVECPVDLFVWFGVCAFGWLFEWLFV